MNRNRLSSIALASTLLLSPIAVASAAWAFAPILADPVREPGEAVPTDAKTAAKQAVRAGKPAPRASFTDAEGETVELAKLVEEGPLVLIFYRGGWCPYCVEQLKAFDKRIADIEAAGGRVVAVSTELPEHTAATKDKNKLGFRVLSDPGAKAARAFGVAWANERYGRGLAKYQGNAKGEIPLGVTYVIDGNGIVRWAYLEHDYKKRATPDQAIEALDAIE